MKSRISAALALAALLAAQLACNLPTQSGGDSGQVPAANQTLTALFAPSPGGTATSTLLPVLTATRPADAAGTQQPAATATRPALTATETQARAPTSTATQPRPTVTVPGVRPRTPVVASFFATPPTLDGDWSEWKDISTEYPANNVVFGRENWIGENDLQASYHLGWDNSNFYVALKVRDERYAQNASGEELYMGDSIEILLDTKLKEDYYWDQLSPDDFQLGISPGRPDPSGVKEAYLWFPSNIAGPRSGVQIASRLDAGLYRVEVAIPWSVFEMTPEAGMHMGFALSVSDNDDASQNLQESMVSNLVSRRLFDPTTWGDLHLVN